MPHWFDALANGGRGVVKVDEGTRGAILSAVFATTAGDNASVPSATELDSHANMVVVGWQVTVISKSGTHAEVRAFSDDCGTLNKISIGDAILLMTAQ